MRRSHMRPTERAWLGLPFDVISAIDENLGSRAQAANLKGVFFGYKENLMRTKLMHRWGFALREGEFAETNEGILRNKNKKGKL